MLSLIGQLILSIYLGAILTVLPVWLPFLNTHGFEALGPILGIVLIVASLFGELPSWIAWIQKLGEKLWPGIALATILLLIPLLIPSPHRESSFFAFSPTVWAAYISIVFVGISFETSSLPSSIYHVCQSLRVKPYLLIPLYVTIAGLLGNILDGVSIVIISSVLLLKLIPKPWAIKSLFALLFGGLISNLITVAAEPTNIKFQDTLGNLLNRMHPSFWITNWPICVLGILFPAVWLSIVMHKHAVSWNKKEPKNIHILQNLNHRDTVYDKVLSVSAMVFLGAGVILHAIFENIKNAPSLPLWILLLPAGLTALLHLFATKTYKGAVTHIKEQSPVWIKLLAIFSLLWFLQHGLTNAHSVVDIFFTIPSVIQYILLIILSLASSVTDNVALAAMQGSIIINHPLPIWEIRLLLVLLTWAGGLTPFGCLQSLSINHRIKLSTALWIKQTPVFAGLAILGGLLGLVIISYLYPSSL